MTKIDEDEISVQVNAQLAALANRMLKMLVEVPPTTFDQAGMAYRCWFCDASHGVDTNLKAAHGEGCRYAVLMVDAGAAAEMLMSNVLE